MLEWRNGSRFGADLVDWLGSRGQSGIWQHWRMLAAPRQMITVHTKSGGKLDGELVFRTDESITFLWRGKRRMTLSKAQFSRVELGKAEPQGASMFESVRAGQR